MGGNLAKANFCRRQAEARGCAPAGPCDEEDAKKNVDWVFNDRGAHNHYLSEIGDGLSPFDALIAAQGHNPPVQKKLRLCQAFVESYLASKDQVPTGSTLPDRGLSSRDCKCISVLPGADGYNVINSCDAMSVNVQFVDGANTMISSWANAGILSKGQSTTVPFPSYTIPSINAVALRTAYSRVMCRL
jgi:hypothetical protein